MVKNAKKKNGNFHLILMFYNDLYEISIALYEKNSNKNSDYSFKYSIRDFNLQNLIEELQMIKKKDKLEKENLLENILNEIKKLIEEEQLDIKNLEKILILSENKQIKNYLKIFENYLHEIKIENTIDFLTLEDNIINGVRKYASINIQKTNYHHPVEQKFVFEKKKKKINTGCR
jgi:archaellum biogenesis ATPase FlaH